MPKSKCKDVRIKVIDRCLSDRNHLYRIAEIFDLCNKELELQDCSQITAMNTIRADIENIESKYEGSEVELIRNGREIYHRYKDPEFSIFRTPMSPEETLQLIQTLGLLKRFKGMPHFDWINEIADRLGAILKIEQISAEQVVGFDENLDLVGLDHFTPLFNAIVEKQSLVLSYRRFNAVDNQQITVYPYYLKQYNKRWFLIAWNADQDFLANFALDRIKCIKNSKRMFQSQDIDFDEYFDEMVGVSKDMRTRPELVKLWVSPSALPYIKTKPLHGTQKSRKCKESGAIITIEVYLNYELEQLLLSFGENIRVLQPESLKVKIEQRLKAAINNYEEQVQYD